MSLADDMCAEFALNNRSSMEQRLALAAAAFALRWAAANKAWEQDLGIYGARMDVTCDDLTALADELEQP